MSSKVNKRNNNKNDGKLSAKPSEKGNNWKSQEKPKSIYTKNESYESSDEEDSIKPDVLNGVFKNVGVDANKESIESLTNAFSFGAVCLICISKVKRADRIWSCTNCYTFFHLNCIQRWGNDSLAQKRLGQELDEGYYNNAGEYIPKQNKPLEWNCPKCRECYAPDEIPRHYLCFCFKQYDPVDQEWLLPHSCGELCMKKLGCDHSCLLLCHPANCPPCPQIITISCECGKSQQKAIRCFEKKWNCFKKCGGQLECGHFCDRVCHKSDQCPPCMKRSLQKCRCGNKIQERNCFEAKFNCTKICGKTYNCGVHKCEKVCCDGDCSSCIFGLVTCPCGKQKSSGVCTDMITSCGDTCERPLICSQHKCVARCHVGSCPDCLVIVPKACRCGLFTKEVACSKEFICETKCKRMRSCRKHPCSKKCCPDDGEETLCEKTCSKTLSCGKHKCQSLCGHIGPCYPCNQQSEVKCK